MTRRTAFWVIFFVLSLSSAFYAWTHFSRAFPIVTLDLRMDRMAALASARTLAGRHGWEPRGRFHQAASFGVDDTVRTFVELQGGGKDAFRRMLREKLYAAYGWRVRHFREGETRETTMLFTPEGEAYGFRERLEENRPGRNLSELQARSLAEHKARTDWKVDLTRYALVEASKEVKPGGRTDQTFVYERRGEQAGEGRYRLRLVVSGDRLTELTHFLKVPEAFTRRYEEMRSANTAIGFGAAVAVVLIYLVGGCMGGAAVLLRQRWLVWRPALLAAAGVAGLTALAQLNEWPLAWMRYDTALAGRTFLIQRIAALAGTFVGELVLLALTFMAAESLSRRAFPHHPQLWRIPSLAAAATRAAAGRTAGGYLLTGLEFGFIIGFYAFATGALGWWVPSEALVHPDVLATYLPWLAVVATPVHAGFWEECLFRAVPLAGAALLGQRLGHRGVWIGVALVVQAAVFGGAHAAYPSAPPYSRLVELLVPSLVWGLVYLRFGLLPTIVTHYLFDLVLFALPLFASSARGARFDQAAVLLCGLAPLGLVLVARLRAGAWSELPESLRNSGWTPAPTTAPAGPPESVVTPGALSPARVRLLFALGPVALVGWLALGPFQADAPPLRLGRAGAIARARAAFAAQGFTPAPPWRTFATLQSDPETEHVFVWRTAGRETYRALLGTHLRPPLWDVRVARFVGPVAERADEWHAYVTGDGAIARVRHRLPQAQPGAVLAEAEARALAQTALRERLRADPRRLREISAVSARLPARRDWTFTYADSGSRKLPQGQLRLEVEIAGDRAVDARRFVHVPESWEREYRNGQTLIRSLRLSRGLLTVLVTLAGMVAAIVAWSRKRFPVRIAMLLFGTLVLFLIAQSANSWPSLAANFSTAQPWELQRMIALVAVAMTQGLLAAAVALLGAWAHGQVMRTTPGPRGPGPSLGLAVGLIAGVVLALGGSIGGQASPRWPDYDAAQSMVPWLAEALVPTVSILIRIATLAGLLGAAHGLTRGWSERRGAVGTLLAVAAGVLAAPGNPPNAGVWAIQVALAGLLFLSLYVLILRYEPSMIPLALVALTLLGQLRVAVLGAHPAALPGALIGAALSAAAAWAWWRAMRGDSLRGEAREAEAGSPGR
jgi:hypothetical protein